MTEDIRKKNEMDTIAAESLKVVTSVAAVFLLYQLYFFTLWLIIIDNKHY